LQENAFKIKPARIFVNITIKNLDRRKILKNEALELPERQLEKLDSIYKLSKLPEHQLRKKRFIMTSQH